MPTETEPIFRNAKHAQETGRRYRRMADEISRYPEHEGQQEKVSELRGKSAHAYRAARALEHDQPAPTRREPKKPEPWTPKKALRRAGVRTGQRADKAARNAPGRAKRTVKANVPLLGGNPTSPGGLIVYVFASVIGLALLDSLLGGRGPAAISNTLGFLSSALQRLFSPIDPLIPRGVQPGTTTTVTPSTTKTPAAAAAKTPAAAAATAAAIRSAFPGASTKPATVIVTGPAGYPK